MSIRISRRLFALIVCMLLPLAGESLRAEYDGCYTPWATRVVLPFYANGQPGLVAFNGQLVLTWGDQTTGYLNSAVSKDGVTWTNQQVLTGFPQVTSSVTYAAPPAYANGGVNMTVSTFCNAVYVAYFATSGNIFAAYATESPGGNGITWQGGAVIYYLPAGNLSSSPALYGNNPALPIGFAVPGLVGMGYQQGKTNDSGGGPTYIYSAQVGKFNCNLSNPTLLTNNCLFWDASTSTCLDWDSAINAEYDEACSEWEPDVPACLQSEYGYNMQYDEGWKYDGQMIGPWSPLWTGAAGVELRALAQGNPVGNLDPPIWYSVNQGNVYCVGAQTACAPPTLSGNWTNNGIGGAVNPVDSSPWLVFSCRDYDNTGHTCGQTPWIQFYHVINPDNPGTGTLCTMDTSQYGTGEWSIAMPAMTFFNGMLWLAWRGDWQSDPGNIAVASIAPANIGWNGAPPPPCTCPTCPPKEVCDPTTCTCVLKSYAPGH